VEGAGSSSAWIGNCAKESEVLTAQKVDMMFRFAECRQPSEDKCLDQMWSSGDETCFIHKINGWRRREL
jgi:hypothetical protein